MKLLTIFCTILIFYGMNGAVVAATSNVSDALDVSNMQIKWITQKLDHFDTNNNKTWQMRYMVDESVYKPGNPIFIHVGSQRVIYPEDPYYLQITDFVQQYKGLLVYTEHRFYGESHPTPDLRVEYLEKYLNIEQAMADLAHVIRTLKTTYKNAKKSKVILVGGAYGGTLATWFTQLYPELTDGAWASSSALLSKTDFFEFKDSAKQSIISIGGVECYNRIRNGIEQAQNIFKNGQATKIKNDLKLCSNFNETYYADRWTIFAVYSNLFANNVQYAESDTIQEMCGNFINENNDYDNFVNFFLYNFYDNSTCLPFNYQYLLQDQKSIEWADNTSGNRVYSFQGCDRFGWFQTSNSPNQPFGSEIPLDFFIKMCKDLFGEKYTAEYNRKRSEEYNKKYGGLNPKVKNVHFSQGSIDPWRTLGVQTYVIEGASHFEDLYKPASTDSPQVAAAHKKIAQLVKSWVSAK